MRSSRNAFRVVCALAACLIMAACGSAADSGGAGNSVASVRVLLDWFPNPDHIGLYTAQQQGYFTAAGLNVTLTPPSDPADPLKLVAIGQVPLGISYEPDTIIARSQGLHVEAVAALIPVALNSLIAPDTSPVHSPRQLAGHTIGTAGLPSDDVYLSQIYKTYGINPASIQKVNVSSDLVSAMISRKVDATVGGYRNIEAVQLRDRGLNPMVVPVTDVGVPDYDELVVVANSDKLKSDASYRESVRRFLSALARGTATAIADPGLAGRAMQRVATGYSPELITKMINATAPLLRNPGGFGYMSLSSWQSFTDWMYRNKLITASVDASTATTDAYIPRLRHPAAPCAECGAFAAPGISGWKGMEWLT